MSRRPGAGPDKAEQNRATLKQLVKLESNKSCADCKKNKHPRWASWNIGIFICIRCSGIHRGMGTHISRVKSVDLDSWTEEQMQSMLRWGNGRANKYWEHKLADGHVPNEAKIENFIRTKYDSKRWVMEGPIPDPSTLDSGEDNDDVPLNVVQQQAKERVQSASMKNGQMAGGGIQPPRQKAPDVDLFGDMSEPAQQPARPSTTEPALNRPNQTKAPVMQQKQTKPGESLLGLDFFGASQSAPPARPSSTGPNPGAMPGRTDLKQSILSLYASKPAAPPATTSQNAFGGMQSPPLASPTQPTSNTQDLGGLGDAFGSLSFSGQQSQPPKATPFSNFAPPAGHSRQASTQNTSALSGGGFFDAKPAAPPKQATPASQPAMARQASNSFGADFGDFSAASPVTSVKNPPVSSGAMGDLFDISAPAPPPKPANNPPPISAAGYSAFNLSQTAAPQAAPAPKSSQPAPVPSFSNSSVWDSNDAWASPDAPTSPAVSSKPGRQQSSSSSSQWKPSPAPAVTSTQTPFDSGWGETEPPKPANTTTTAGGFSVQQDEEFGGWSHASPVATSAGPKAGGVGGGSDDLFGNVWE